MNQLNTLSTQKAPNMTARQQPSMSADSALVDSDEFNSAFGESLAQTLDLDTWRPGEDLAALYSRLEQEVEAAVEQEDRIRQRIRQEVFPVLQTRSGAPRSAGVYQAKPRDIERVHRGLLFNGAVEACDGTSLVHDTLPITIAQIGVALVSYQGNQGSWVQRLYRRDLRMAGLNPVDEALEILQRRQNRSGFDMSNQRDTLSNLACRGIMTYAERAVLLHKSDKPWRMGHGNPIAYELLTGSGMTDLLDRSIDLLDELVLQHKRFVFVPSAAAKRELLTIGNALHPLEYAIVKTMKEIIDSVIDNGHYTGAWKTLLPRLKKFAAEAGNQGVVGLYRASKFAPPQLFYAHVEYAHEAALIALADSTLQEHRGFPMLIDLADNVCSSTFGADSFTASTQLAYAEAGEPFRYLTERQTRR